MVPIKRVGNWVPGPGRPTSATPELKEELLDRLSAGEFLTVICREDHMPSSRTVYGWLAEDKTFSAGFARARELGALSWVEEGVHTARTLELGQVVTYSADGMTLRREDMLGHRKLKSDTYFKAAAMVCPSKFGAKVALTGGGEDDKPLNIKTRVIEEVLVRHERLAE